MTGPLESTSEAYAIAKIAGIKLCQAYQQQCGADMISAIPGDVFGPGDDFGLADSHVIAALIRKMHQANVFGAATVEVWGSGSPRREFCGRRCRRGYLSDANCSSDPYQRGWVDTSIRDIAERIQKVVGYPGQLRFDPTRPDGMPLKALDSSELMAMGWQPKVSLQRGLEETYRLFLDTTSQHG
jgi:GDP-L-fucose synthase